MSGKNWAFPKNAFLFCFFLMIRNCRFDLIQHLLFPDDNTQCQPFDQLFHYGIQERNLVETDSYLIQKMEDCHIFYNSIVCMLEFSMPAQRLVRCMTIFTRGFHVYGSHCHPHNDSYAGFPPPQTSTHIYMRNRWDTLKLMVSCPRTRCDASTLETKTELLDVKSSAQPLATMPG